ncbi:DUF2381 family protein [Hyalangium minutum]|uniref:Myxococcus xanthus paralogous family TIGR02268 n=1 Tax=Hyalangium minutum TaxID=394096 RepID=A0A085WGT4_9BACT|nr:DUF2381 family protein [Hyalangium minutum]KFE66897.1 hypothetical protein DB31_9111 [Hyalangium minutum]
MFQSTSLAVALVLLTGTVARAQATAREPRHRTVTVTGNPSEPPPEVHVSAETPTVFLFGAELRKKSVRVDEARIRVVDTGEQSRTIVVQAVSPPSHGERHELEVEFADGKAPSRAVFALVVHPANVDTLISVARQEPAAPACLAEVREGVRGPEDFLLLGYMGESGVPTAKVGPAKDAAQGLESAKGVAYRGKGWLMVQVRLRNQRGPQPWVPTEATLTSKTGEKLRGRVVLEEQGEPEPGKAVRVLVVTEEPPAGVGLFFILELSGADGRTLAIPEVKIPAPAKEPKP